jgi:hypothetical protein
MMDLRLCFSSREGGFSLLERILKATSIDFLKGRRGTNTNSGAFTERGWKLGWCRGENLKGSARTH